MKKKRLVKCPATIVFGDDYGDNKCTFFCKLEEGHSGSHIETGEMEGWSNGKETVKLPYKLTWEINRERKADG